MKYTDNSLNILTAKYFKGIGNAWIVKNLKGNESIDTIVSLLNKTIKGEPTNVEEFERLKKDFETNEIKVNIPKNNGETTCSIGLEKRIIKFAVGEDVGPKIGIKKIYFDLSKYYIRPDAALELQKVLALMNEYPKMKIDIRSHTDSRQSTKNNQILSENRAKSTMEWLIKNEIAADRLTAKGYGESQLINQCADGIKCTEEEHQANRRSEFIIVSM